MSTIDNVTLIACVEARERCKGEPDLMERIRKAMRACHGHWMQTNETEQFRAAIAAAITESSGEEKERIQRSANALQKASAALAAAKAGVSVDFLSIEVPADMIPLRKMWEETRS